MNTEKFFEGLINSDVQLVHVMNSIDQKHYPDYLIKSGNKYIGKINLHEGDRRHQMRAKEDFNNANRRNFTANFSIDNEFQLGLPTTKAESSESDNGKITCTNHRTVCIFLMLLDIKIDKDNSANIAHEFNLKDSKQLLRKFIESSKRRILEVSEKNNQELSHIQKQLDFIVNNFEPSPLLRSKISNLSKKIFCLQKNNRNK